MTHGRVYFVTLSHYGPLSLSFVTATLSAMEYSAVSTRRMLSITVFGAVNGPEASRPQPGMARNSGGGQEGNTASGLSNATGAASLPVHTRASSVGGPVAPVISPQTAASRRARRAQRGWVKLLRVVTAPAALLDDLALTSAWQGWMWGVETTLFGGLCLLFQLLSLRGLIGPGGAFVPLIFHRFVTLIVDVLLIMCSVGPWDTRHSVGPLYSGVWLPRLLRLADGMGCGLTTLMTCFLVAGSTIDIALPTAGAGIPGRMRPAMSLYKTLLFPIFLSTAVQALALIAVLCSAACGVGGVTDQPLGPLFGIRTVPRWRLVLATYGSRMLIVLLNCTAVPFALKMDDYPSLSWGAVLLVPTISVGILGGLVLCLLVACVVDAVISHGRLGRGVRRGASTSSPWSMTKSTLAGVIISGGALVTIALGNLIFAAEQELGEADAALMSDPVAWAFHLDAKAVLHLVSPWAIATGIGTLTVWFGTGKLLNAWRAEFAAYHGVLTPSAHAAAAHAAWNAARASDASARELLSPVAGPLLPPPSSLVRIGYTRYRRLKPDDDVPALSRGVPPADADDEFKSWLAALQLQSKVEKTLSPTAKGMSLPAVLNGRAKTAKRADDGTGTGIELVTIAVHSDARDHDGTAHEVGTTRPWDQPAGSPGTRPAAVGHVDEHHDEDTSLTLPEELQPLSPALRGYPNSDVPRQSPWARQQGTAEGGAGRLHSPGSALVAAALRSPAAVASSVTAALPEWLSPRSRHSYGHGRGQYAHVAHLDGDEGIDTTVMGQAVATIAPPQDHHGYGQPGTGRTSDAAVAIDVTVPVEDARQGTRAASPPGRASGTGLARGTAGTFVPTQPLHASMTATGQPANTTATVPVTGMPTATPRTCTTRGPLRAPGATDESTATTSHSMCAICFETECDTALLECGHAVCGACAGKLLSAPRSSARRCPFCRAHVSYACKLGPLRDGHSHSDGEHEPVLCLRRVISVRTVRRTASVPARLSGIFGPAASGLDGFHGIRLNGANTNGHGGTGTNVDVISTIVMTPRFGGDSAYPQVVTSPVHRARQQRVASRASGTAATAAAGRRQRDSLVQQRALEGRTGSPRIVTGTDSPSRQRAVAHARAAIAQATERHNSRLAESAAQSGQGTPTRAQERGNVGRRPSAGYAAAQGSLVPGGLTAPGVTAQEMVDGLPVVQRSVRTPGTGQPQLISARRGSVAYSNGRDQRAGGVRADARTPASAAPPTLRLDGRPGAGHDQPIALRRSRSADGVDRPWRGMGQD